MVQIKYTGDTLWARVERAVEKVKERMRRVTSALDSAGIPYAIAGGNAVQLWVAQVDETAVRNTRDVDIILNRADLDAAIPALEVAGFNFRQGAGVSMFLDGTDAKARDAVHVVFAGEKVREDDLEPVPTIERCELLDDVRLLPMQELVRMKLTSYCDKDRVQLRDMLAVGLVDESWLSRFRPELRARLQELIENPDG